MARNGAGDLNLDNSENWGITEIGQETFSFLWTLKNYVAFINGSEFVESSIFRGGPKSNHSWQLKIYPKKKLDEQEYLSVRLILKDFGDGKYGNASKDRIIKAQFEFSLLDGYGQPRWKMGITGAHEFKKGASWGYEKYILSKDLIAPDNRLLENGVLKIRCRIWLEEVLEHKVSDPVTEMRADLLLREEKAKMRKEQLSRSFGKLFLDALMTDVALKCKTTTFTVHKAVLCARSPVFAAMFSVNMLEKSTNSMEIPDFDCDLVKGMLEYLYTGETVILSERAPDLLQVAEKYDLAGLKKDCECAIADNLCFENAVEVLVMAHRYNASLLKSCAIEFVNCNLENVKKTKSFQLVAQGLVMGDPNALSGPSLDLQKCLKNVTDYVHTETEMQQEEISFLWTLRNFPTVCVSAKYLSPIFHGGTISRHSWRLIIFPKKKVEEQEYLSLYLMLSDFGDGNNSKDKSIKVRFEFTILDADGKPGRKLGDATEFKKSKDWGFSKVILWKDLISPERRLLVDGTLKIRCRAWIYGVIQHQTFESKNAIRHLLDENKLERGKWQLSSDFGKLFKDSLVTDVAIIGAQQTYMAHKVILAARSAVFAAILRENTNTEDTCDMVDISDVDDDVVKGMLEYLYTGETDMMPARAPNLLQVAERYDLDGLKEDCEHAIANILNFENAIDVLVIANFCKASYLKSRVTDYINCNLEHVCKTKSFQLFAQTNEIKVGKNDSIGLNDEHKTVSLQEMTEALLHFSTKGLENADVNLSNNLSK